MIIDLEHSFRFVPAGFLLVALGFGHAAMLQAVKVESSSRLVNPARHYITCDVRANAHYLWHPEQLLD